MKAAEPKHVESKTAEPKGAEPKTAEAKGAEPKVAETKRPPATAGSSPTATVAAVQQILKKLGQDSAKNPGESPRPHGAVSPAAPPPSPRLQVAWRISLTWPDALTAPKP